MSLNFRAQNPVRPHEAMVSLISSSGRATRCGIFDT
jgi:hypothetical protein